MPPQSDFYESLAESLSAATGAAVSKCFSYPLDLIITKLATQSHASHGDRKKNLMVIVSDLTKKKGNID